MKRRYRQIDFKRDKWDVKGKVKTVEYDPNRSAFISLVHYTDGEKRYILSVDRLGVGSEIISSRTAKSKEGNCLPLLKVNVGFFVHNVELRKGHGGQIVRSAGTGAKVFRQRWGLHNLILTFGGSKVGAWGMYGYGGGDC